MYCDKKCAKIKHHMMFEIVIYLFIIYNKLKLDDYDDTSGWTVISLVNSLHISDSVVTLREHIVSCIMYEILW